MFRLKLSHLQAYINNPKLCTVSGNTIVNIGLRMTTFWSKHVAWYYIK